MSKLKITIMTQGFSCFPCLVDLLAPKRYKNGKEHWGKPEYFVSS